MTAFLVLSHAGLACLVLACSWTGEETRARVTRVAATAGVLVALGLVVLRGSLEPWRAIAFEPGAAAIAGVAAACAWGLAMALDLGRDRWWIAAIVGVASTASLGVAGAVWAVPALLFATGWIAASALALGRSNRAALLVIVVSDAALVVALAGHALDAESWRLPTALNGAVAIPLAISMLLRAGAIPRIGIAATMRTPAAALAPILTGSAFVLLVRFVERPEPAVAAAALLGACLVALVAVARRSLDPATLGSWPVLLGGGIALASTRAGVPAAVAAVIGSTAVWLWPDALERGRLSRGFVLSSIAPNVVYGALATAASGAFVAATAVADPTTTAAWTALSALLPIAVASGIALGVVVARADVGGGYHPEAVFMTWMLLAGSVVAGLVLGAGGVYGALGGIPALILVAFGLACGGFAAMRARHRELAPIEPLAEVIMRPPRDLGRWATGAALGLLIVTGAATTWVTVDGLRIGFL